MKKIFSLMLGLAIAGSIAAETYFFSPNGNGEQDGSSWDNAAPGEYLGTTLAEAEPGTAFYLMEGNYAPDASTLKWIIPEGILLKGGYPTSMTGTDLNYDYMQGGQSIFSADLDGDGKGDNSNYAFVYIGKGPADAKDTEYYKNFQLTEIWGITFRDGKRVNSKYWGNMVFIKHAKVDFHFCSFLNNDSQTTDDSNGANGAITAWGSQLRCFDCIFRDNVTAKGSGAAFLLRARNSDSGDHAATENSIGLFERCEFTNNIAFSTQTSTPDNAKWGTYGGGMAQADNAGSCYIINSTITESKAWYRGVGIRVSKNDTCFFIGNTFVDNPARLRTGATNGSDISTGDYSTCYFAGNIIVDKAADDDYTNEHAVICFQSASSKAYSLGNNITGTIFDNGNNLTGWLTSDVFPSSLATVNTKESVFGTNQMTDNGGFSRTIAPSQTLGAWDIAALQTAVAAWPMSPVVTSVMDLTKDQRGYTRAAQSMPGAFDANAVAPTPSALPYVAAPMMSGRRFNVLGQEVGEDYKGIIIMDGKKVINQ